MPLIKAYLRFPQTPAHQESWLSSSDEAHPPSAAEGHSRSLVSLSQQRAPCFGPRSLGWSSDIFETHPTVSFFGEKQNATWPRHRPPRMGEVTLSAPKHRVRYVHIWLWIRENRTAGKIHRPQIQPALDLPSPPLHNNKNTPLSNALQLVHLAQTNMGRRTTPIVCQACVHSDVHASVTFFPFSSSLGSHSITSIAD